MDEVDTPLRPRRPRAKDKFQTELGQKLRERKARGLAVDITSEESEDVEEDSLHSNKGMYSQYAAARQTRPGSAKRRPDHAGSSTWSPNLQDTLRSEDLERYLGRKTPSFEDYDDEVDQTFSKKPASQGLGQWRTSPLAKESLLGRKTPVGDDAQKGGLFGNKTPTRQSPVTQELSKEDIIFGRKTPTKSSKSPTGDLPSLGGTWQPPSFRNVSPSADQRGQAASPAGSQGRRTPGLESGLDPISEDRTPREKPPRYGRIERGREKESPRLSDDSPRSDRPTPQARHKPIFEKEEPQLKRTSPTLDLFGKSGREARADVEKELMEIDEKKEEHRARQRRLQGQKTPPGRKTPADRSTPTGRKSPSPVHQDGRKTPVDARGRKTPVDRRGEADELPGQDRHKKEENTPSLLDFLTGDMKPQPKPKERPRQNRIPKDETPDITLPPSRQQQERKQRPESPVKLVDGKENLEKHADTSSICEEVKEDPDAHRWREDIDEEGTKGPQKQRTEREEADNAIEQIRKAQENKRELKTTKKIRPISAEAKVIHRPKPRYGPLPGQATAPAEVTNFNSTMDIREAVYSEWYHQHIKKAKEEKRLKEQKEKEEEKKKKKAKEEKEMDAKLSFQSWQENKKEVLAKEKAKKLKEEEKKREKEEEDRESKRVASEVSFKSWKEKKDEKLKEDHKQKKMTDKEKKQLEKEEKENKEKEGMTAFRGWKERKDAELHRREIEQQKKKKKEETTLEATRRQKEEEAAASYEEWMAGKEKQEQRQKIKTTKMSGDLYDFHPPWSPANHTVPFGR